MIGIWTWFSTGEKYRHMVTNHPQEWWWIIQCFKPALPMEDGALIKHWEWTQFHLTNNQCGFKMKLLTSPRTMGISVIIPNQLLDIATIGILGSMKLGWSLGFYMPNSFMCGDFWEIWGIYHQILGFNGSYYYKGIIIHHNGIVIQYDWISMALR